MTATAFDLSARMPTYCRIVFSGQISRAIATTAAIAVALVGLLPAEHVHAGDHTQVVHRHVIGEASAHHDPQHDAEVADADHDDARILTLSYKTASRFSLAPHLAVMALPVVEPCSAQETPITGTTLLPTHDPPLRFTSSPAPPFFV